MILERKDIDKKYKWDLTVIYKDEAAFNADYTKCEALIKDFAKHEATMAKSAEGLYNALTDKEIDDPDDIKTGDVLIYTVWIIGFGALAYAVYHFITRRKNI